MFSSFASKAQEADKLMIRDIRNINVAECLEKIKLVRLLFTNVLQHTRSVLYHAQPGAGAPKKGMPGYCQFSSQVEINAAEVVGALIGLLEKESLSSKVDGKSAGSSS